jgi:serine-aspartate repeat-containing protein C/D/E
MDTSGLTGSDLEDKLLQDVLLYSCMTDTVYSSGYEDWVAYSDPIPAEPVTVESTPAPTPLTEPAPTPLTEPAPAPTPETTPETTPEPTPEPT